MTKDIKIKLLFYMAVTAITFPYLIIKETPGISVPIFILIQFLSFYFIVPNKKPLILFAPIFILSLNSFIYANDMWRTSNFIIIVLLYSVMIIAMNCKFNFKDTSLKFISKTLETVFYPFSYINLPFRWLTDINKENTNLMKRIFIALVISAPILLFMLIMLISADNIFAHVVNNVFNDIFSLFDADIFLKIISGILMGFYAFGLAAHSYLYKKVSATPYPELSYEEKKESDPLIINIFLCLVLFLYTFFVLIQFRYLFAGVKELPYGLTYTEYARKGFFELFFLTGLNILIILICVNKNSKSSFTKFLLFYLCAVTFILLISSFYRMSLYSIDDGLTRLRFLVFGFLIFEAAGLILTFFYISKPKFNIVAAYIAIAFSYYLVLNVIPIDLIVAKSQVDRYLKDQSGGLEYTISLSADAAEQIERLYQTGGNSDYADEYFDKYKNYNKSSWHEYNLSTERVINYAKK